MTDKGYDNGCKYKKVYADYYQRLLLFDIGGGIGSGEAYPATTEH